MSVRLVWGGVLVAGCAALSGCGPDWVPAKAMVTSIDRQCEIITIHRKEMDDPRGTGRKLDVQDSDSHTGQCSDVAEWDEVRTKRTKKVEGDATVHVMYTLADGKTGTGTLQFDGGDDEFYSLHVDDNLDVLVDPGNPEHLRKA